MAHYCVDCQRDNKKCTCFDNSPVKHENWCATVADDDRMPCTCAAGSIGKGSVITGEGVVEGAGSVGKSSGGRSDAQSAVFAAIYSGGSSDYYKVTINRTTTPYAMPYTAECNDIIEALGMNFAEGNAFKALWRRAAQRTLGLRKVGAKDDGLYDAEKVEFFGKRLVEQSKAGHNG